MASVDLPKKVKLKDGRIATIDFLSETDSALEFRRFINTLVAEKIFIIHDQKVSLKEEKEWKKKFIVAFRKRTGYLLVARVGGRIAGTSSAERQRGKSSGNVSLGIAIMKGYRGIGLGKALLELNIEAAKNLLKPKNIFLSVFAPNKPARSLYKKLGFRKFAVFPKWILHEGKYVDHVYMRLKR